MANVIVYTRPDGGVSIVNLSPSAIAKRVAGGMTEDQAFAAIQAKSVPSDASNIEVTDQALIPVSREYRDAWEKPVASPIIINMPKARMIHSGNISAAKADAITTLGRGADEATLEGRTADATKAANDKAAVEGLNLTTIAAQIAGAANPTALSAIWPAELQEFKP